MHREISFNSSPYVASYIAKYNYKSKQFKHDDVQKAFTKLMNSAPFGKTIENLARRTDIRMLNDTVKARKHIEKRHCADFRIFDGEVA